ncbi:MAG: GIY-YIG nuclease family protein [Patescibacteria group bacterium]
MKFYVYAIKNGLGKIYVGHTNDLKQRIDRHNNLLPHKKLSYTYKNGGSWELVYKEEYLNHQEAMTREKQLKSYQGRLFIKNIINNRP